ncbi:MAG: GAF domain-containing protein [Anaerolineales bacterium]|nr:GAF domain-containing protein [Anaerolineales bacterium]
MSRTLPLSPFVAVSERLVQLETMVRAAHATEDPMLASEYGEPGAADGARQKREARWAEALDLVQDLRRWFDRINFLYDTTRQMRQILTVQEVLTLIVDTIWQRRYSFIVILLGETELGPYYYEEMRGVVDPRRYLGKQCPLPLWGELAHALVRRLDSDEPDYLIIDDMQTAGRPKPDEFPWLEREGAMMIVPLRRNGVAFGAMILGRPEIGGFHDPVLCAELLEIGDGGFCGAQCADSS